MEKTTSWKNKKRMRPAFNKQLSRYKKASKKEVVAWVGGFLKRGGKLKATDLSSRHSMDISMNIKMITTDKLEASSLDDDSEYQSFIVPKGTKVIGTSKINKFYYMDGFKTSSEEKHTKIPMDDTIKKALVEEGFITKTEYELLTKVEDNYKDALGVFGAEPRFSAVFEVERMLVEFNASVAGKVGSKESEKALSELDKKEIESISRYYTEQSRHYKNLAKEAENNLAVFIKKNKPKGAQSN